MRVIATDVDGTLVRPDHTISPRTLAALDAALDAGWWVIPISGRHPYSIMSIIEGTRLKHHCVGSNGAVGMDLRTEQVLFEQTLSVEAQHEFVARLAERVPGIVCTSVRDAGRTFVPQVGYAGLMDPGDHAVVNPPQREYPLEEVLGMPSLKLVVRHSDVREDALLEVARELDVPGVVPSISGAPFLEVAGAGVTKASGLALMARHLGFEASDVVAFGDNINDVELLQWAGLGVAMGNGVREAFDAADEVTATNTDDGLAVVVERMLGLSPEPA